MAQTTTARGRAQLVTPDVGYDAEIDGGVALGGVINALWGQISDNLGLRWSGAVTVANSNYVDVVHSYGFPSSAITVRIAKNTGAPYTRFEEQTAFTIAYPDDNTVRVTNISGGSLTFYVTILPYKLGLRAADFDEGVFGSESDDIRLNSDANGSSGDWFATIRRPSIGMTASSIITLPLSTSTLATLGLAETITGTKTTDGLLRATKQTDSSATGAGASLATPTKSIVQVTNASLTSLAMIPAPAAGASQTLLLVNRTGATVQLQNETGATAANRIVTGSGSPLDLPTNSLVPLIYDQDVARWLVYGGSGSGSSGDATVSQTSHGLSAGDWVRTSGADLVKAQASSLGGSVVVGRVKSVTDANTFVLQTSGTYSGSFSAGATLFLSPSSAGGTASGETSTDGEIVKPVAIAISTTLAVILIGDARGVGAFASTDATQTLRRKTNTAAVGSVSAPSYSFEGFTTSGFYFASGTTLRLAFAGANRHSWTGTGYAMGSTANANIALAAAAGTFYASVSLTNGSAFIVDMGVAGASNDIISGSVSGSAVYSGPVNHLWSCDYGTTIHFSVSASSIACFAPLIFQNRTFDPTLSAGMAFYRSDRKRFKGTLGTVGFDFLQEAVPGSTSTFAAGATYGVNDAPREYQTIASTGGAVTLSTTPFTSTDPENGKEIWLIGTSNTDTVTITPNDAANGCLQNGDITLSRGVIAGWKYFTVLDRWVSLGVMQPSNG